MARLLLLSICFLVLSLAHLSLSEGDWYYKKPKVPGKWKGKKLPPWKNHDAGKYGIPPCEDEEHAQDDAKQPRKHKAPPYKSYPYNKRPSPKYPPSPPPYHKPESPRYTKPPSPYEPPHKSPPYTKPPAPSKPPHKSPPYIKPPPYKPPQKSPAYTKPPPYKPPQMSPPYTKPPQKSPPYKPNPTTYTPPKANAWAKQWLDPHNAARAELGLPPMVWNETVAKYAEWWASQRKLYGNCQMQHSNGPYGENLFWGIGYPFEPSDCVEAWVSEKDYYHYSDNSCDPGQMCGHYTQVIWKISVHLGCARVQCDSGDILMTCNYDPPGNWIGYKPY